MKIYKIGDTWVNLEQIDAVKELYLDWGLHSPFMCFGVQFKFVSAITLINIPIKIDTPEDRDGYYEAVSLAEAHIRWIDYYNFLKAWGNIELENRPEEYNTK